MTVAELIEQLETFDGDAEILLAHQPSWPLAFTLADVIDGNDAPWDESFDNDETPPDSTDLPTDVVWLVEGIHPDATDSSWSSPYAPRWVFER